MWYSVFPPSRVGRWVFQHRTVKRRWPAVGHHWALVDRGLVLTRRRLSVCCPPVMRRGLLKKWPRAARLAGDSSLGCWALVRREPLSVRWGRLLPCRGPAGPGAPRRGARGGGFPFLRGLM